VADMEPWEVDAANQCRVAWLKSIGVNELEEHRLDTDAVFLAGFQAGEQYAEHGETHYGWTPDCPWCQQERLAGQHGEAAASRADGGGGAPWLNRWRRN
jgi:hypothetical protein